MYECIKIVPCEEGSRNAFGEHREKTLCNSISTEYFSIQFQVTNLCFKLKLEPRFLAIFRTEPVVRTGFSASFKILDCAALTGGLLRMPKNKSKKISGVEPEEQVVVYGVPRSHPSTGTTTKLVNNLHLNGQTSHTNIPAEPSLGERLQKDLGAAEDVVDPGPPKADNLAILLEQGLKSSDNSLLQSVLNRSDEALIRKTIELLPLQYSVPLIQHLGKMCAEERPRPNKAPLLWLSNTLTIRSSYLTTLPNLSEALRNVYVHSDRRIRHTDRFVRLAGTISASVNLVKQRMAQKAAVSSHKSEILSYDEPLDESDSEEEDTADTDEEMPSDTESDDDSMDADDVLRRKNASKAFNASDDEDNEPDLPEKKTKMNGKHFAVADMESDEEDV